MHLKPLRERFIAAGVLTEADFDEPSRAYDAPSFWFVGFTIFGTWAAALANDVHFTSNLNFVWRRTLNKKGE